MTEAETTLKHDAFGDRMSSTDALGRTTKRTDKLGTQVVTMTSMWDTTPHDIAKLQALTSLDALKTFSYTNKRQPPKIPLSHRVHVPRRTRAA